jgi:hypothetical protein
MVDLEKCNMTEEHKAAKQGGVEIKVSPGYKVKDRDSFVEQGKTQISPKAIMRFKQSFKSISLYITQEIAEELGRMICQQLVLQVSFFINYKIVAIGRELFKIPGQTNPCKYLQNKQQPYFACSKSSPF